LHEYGVWHADLNAHNILVAGGAGVSLIDFDRARRRAAGSWREANLERLHRSLDKVCARLPAGRFTPHDWATLRAGYDSGSAAAGQRRP
jgi:Ser/Thr protein kinase RdoA (MazF antagonist)